MFSATKFVLAGAIVALFGGFMLSGVLTQQQGEPLPAVGASADIDSEPSPEVTSAPETSINSDLLPGVDLVTEEVEPGVYRVASDGIRELEFPAFWSRQSPRMVTGLDGSLWLQDVGNKWANPMTRVGSAELVAAPAPVGEISVAPDGTVWLARRDAVYSFDGVGWETRLEGQNLRGVRISPDGTVWVRQGWRSNEPRPSFLRLTDSGWERIRRLPKSETFQLRFWEAGPDGTLWAQRKRDLFFFDGERWSDVGRLDGAQRYGFNGPVLAPDGRFITAKAMVDSVTSIEPDGTRSEADVAPLVPETTVPQIDARSPWAYALGSDGAVWRSLQSEVGRSASADVFGCGGVGRYEGGRWSVFLADRCVTQIEVADDGSTWVMAYGLPTNPVELVSDDRRMDIFGSSVAGLYVITPEAVAASE